MFSPRFHLFAVPAPISPFIGRITPGRLAGTEPMTGVTATNWQPSKNLGMRVLIR
jgi:hypothetical protein